MTRLLLALVPVMCLLPLGVNPSVKPAEPLPQVEVQQEVAETGRLRKLHLVRPDLIPYPVAYDIYC